MNISAYLHSKSIRVRRGTKDKYAALRETAELLQHDERVADFEGFYADVVRREQLMSTGVGRGLAFPDALSKHLTGFVLAIGVYPDGILFDTLDGAPVRLMVMIGVPHGRKPDHLPLLSSLIRLLMDDSVRGALMESVSPEQFIATFKQAEADAAAVAREKPRGLRGWLAHLWPS